MTVYAAHDQSHLEYDCIVWCSTYFNQSPRVESIQKPKAFNLTNANTWDQMQLDKPRTASRNN